MMKSKAHILVVEDKAIIYQRMKMLLESHGYSVSPYTKSVVNAEALIKKSRPDLVLLDIDLQGDNNGIYLGKLLASDYQIPFIYVTDFDDDQTFYQSLETNHADFISKKEINLNEKDQKPLIINTKPHLDEKRLIRAIQTTLKQKKQKLPFLQKDFVLAYVDYVEETKSLSKNQIQQKSVELKNITYFTRNSTEVNKELSAGRNYKEYIKLKNNYIRLLDWQNQSLYLPCNLKAIVDYLPYYFVQISDHMVVNIHPDELKGTVNGSFFMLRDGEKYKISNTFKPEVKKRIAHFYLTSEHINNN